MYFSVEPPRSWNKTDTKDLHIHELLAAGRADAMQILLIEDDPKAALHITEGLQKHDHVVRWAATGADGLAQARNCDHGLFIVDRMLPALDGLTLVKKVRERGSDVPILMLTTMSDLDDRVEGLEAGADDYLTKPFALAELLARISALTRRTHRLGNTQAALRLGALELDRFRRIVTREGKEIDLQHQEFKLLEYLLQNAGRIVTRTMLLENVWDLRFDPRSNIVESHMSRLRSKLDRGFATEMIQTVRGAGYLIRAD
jgi:two-component system, OmpR family, response regulator